MNLQPRLKHRVARIVLCASVLAAFFGVSLRGANWTNAPYEGWVADWTALNPDFGSVSGPNADPDGDGYANNVEFAFDGNPTKPTAAFFSVSPLGSNAVFSFVARDTDPAGALYQVQSTTNLAAGFTNDNGVNLVVGNPDGILLPSQYHRLEFSIPLTESRKFYRVQATPDYGAVYFASNPDGTNSVVALTRDLSTGFVTYLGSFASGGSGTTAIQGSQAHAVVTRGPFLYAVNSGSGNFSTFRVGQDGQLTLIATTPSGGVRPVSIAIHENLLYVLNQGVSASEEGGPIDAGVLPFAIGTDGIPTAAGPGVSLSSADSPSDVIFTGNGQRLAVMCTGANAIRSYDIGPSGSLGNAQVVGVGSQPVGGASNTRLAWCGFATVVDDPGPASVVSFDAQSALSVVSQIPAAADQDPCWAATDPAGFRLWTSNFLPRSLTLYSIAADGALARLGAYEPPASDSGPGALDIGVSGDGRFLYRLRAFHSNGSPTPPHPYPVVEVFRITGDAANGDLQLIQSLQISIEALRFSSPSGMAVLSL